VTHTNPLSQIPLPQSKDRSWISRIHAEGMPQFPKLTAVLFQKGERIREHGHEGRSLEN
jgi:hypothetical protein